MYRKNMKKFSLILPLVLSTFAFAAPPQKMTFEEIQQLSAQGNIEAQTRLGKAYLNGNYEQKVDYQKAFEWTNKAAEQGNSRAKMNLAILYLNGYAVAYDYQKAFKLFQEADAAGEMKAARYLGIIYERGLGVTQDYAKAAAFFQKGDDNNDTTAQYHLAKLYEQGLGVARDYQKAISLYLKHEKRVDHITAPSFLALGDIYALGLSVEKNLSEAKKWYTLAVKAGSQEAKEKLADLATKSY